MSQHKSCCNNPNTHGYNSPIYQYIRELGGWEFVKHVMIEEYSACQNKLQLIKKEQEHLDAFASSKNAIRSYRTEDQIKEQQKKYDDSRKEQKKAYHDSRKESRKDYDRLRYLTKKNEQTELVQSTTL